jgi:hypothetical protein
MNPYSDDNNALTASVLEHGLLDELLAGLGARLPRWDGKKMKGDCPMCDRPDFVLTTARQKAMGLVWYCNVGGCQKGQKALKVPLLGLVRGLLRLRQGSASLNDAVEHVAEFIHAQTGESPSVSTRIQPPSRSKKEKMPWAPHRWTFPDFTARLQVPCPHFLARGFTPEVLARYGVGYSRRKRLTWVPILGDDTSRVISYTTREVKPACAECGLVHPPKQPCRFGGRPRWMVEDGFPRGRHLFGLPQAQASPSPSLLVVEGVADVLRAAEAGAPAVSTMGNVLSREQAQKLADSGRRIVLVPDEDDGGRTRLPTSLKRLKELGAAFSVLRLPPGHKDLGEVAVDDARRWLADAGLLGTHAAAR